MKRAMSQTIFLRSIVYISAVITLMTVAGILIYILIKGVPHISWDLFAFKYTSENVSLFPALVNTFTMTITALLMAAPLGI
ncbi:MAG: phosphate ABC transporter, permease protein PstA, partial [Clostridiaceae bacterium]|nr:phosphate ABC transporter, permease protein PstA [Clostridiaceae bacterium]